MSIRKILMPRERLAGAPHPPIRRTAPNFEEKKPAGKVVRMRQKK